MYHVFDGKLTARQRNDYRQDPCINIIVAQPAKDCHIKLIGNYAVRQKRGHKIIPAMRQGPRPSVSNPLSRCHAYVTKRNYKEFEQGVIQRWPHNYIVVNDTVMKIKFIV